MDFRQIETFVRIVELGSFSAAAEAVHASQSTVSARIKALERFLGASLFDRSHHRPQLTPKGRELFESARQLVDYTHSLTRAIRDPAAMTGTLRLGVVGVVANTWLPALVKQLREQLPRLAIRLDVGLTRVLMDRLSEGRIDMAIIAGSVADPTLRQQLLGHDDFVWMAAPALALPRGLATLSPHDIEQMPLLTWTEESHHFPVVQQWFRDAGITIRPIATSNNMDTLAELTRQGLGVSLLPRHCFRGDLARGSLRVITTQPPLPRVSFSLVHRIDREPVVAQTVMIAARQASDLGEAATTERPPDDAPGPLPTAR